MNDQVNQQAVNHGDDSGNNNGQVATGNMVIQVGSINGGTVNLQPAASPSSRPDNREAPFAVGQRQTLLVLRQVLISRFDEEELRDLIFDLAIDYDSLSGAAKKDKARELISFCRRHGCLPELKQAVLERRPDAW